MPRPLDFNGMLSRLQGQGPAVPHSVLDDLTAATAAARRGLTAFGPSPVTPPTAEPVVRDRRRRS